MRIVDLILKVLKYGSYMRISLITLSLVFAMSLTACQTGDALQTTMQTAVPESAPTSVMTSPNVAQISPSVDARTSAFITDGSSYADQKQLNSNVALLGELDSSNADIIVTAPLPPRTRKTYLINGLMSAIPFIGFGFRNLHKKMPEAQIYSYLSPVESVGIIMPKVMKDIEAAYAKDPNVAINLIGISLGADFVSIVAEKLHRKNIPVNYLGIVDGTMLRPIQSNVKKVDNLTCTYLDCVRGRVRLAKGNSNTIFTKKKYKSSHIPLGNNEQLHARVIAQSRS